MSPLFSKGMGGSSAVAARPTSKKKSLEVAKTTSKKNHAFSSMRSLDHCTTTDNNLPGSAWGANLKPRDELVMPRHYRCNISHTQYRVWITLVWITLIKLPYAPLQYLKIDPDIHQGKRLCGRLLPSILRISEKNSSETV